MKVFRFRTKPVMLIGVISVLCLVKATMFFYQLQMTEEAEELKTTVRRESLVEVQSIPVVTQNELTAAELIGEPNVVTNDVHAESGSSPAAGNVELSKSVEEPEHAPVIVEDTPAPPKPNVNVVDDMPDPKQSTLDKPATVDAPPTINMTDEDPLIKTLDISHQDMCFTAGTWKFNPQSSLHNYHFCPHITVKQRCDHGTNIHGYDNIKTSEAWRKPRADSTYRGRLNYTNWDWVPPAQCASKLLSLEDNLEDLLEKYRDKTIVLMGDSYMRTQWETLQCTISYNFWSPEKRGKKFNYVQVGTVNSASRHFCWRVIDTNTTICYTWESYLLSAKNINAGKFDPQLEEFVLKSLNQADYLIAGVQNWWNSVHLPPLDTPESKAKRLELFDKTMRNFMKIVEGMPKIKRAVWRLNGYGHQVVTETVQSPRPMCVGYLEPTHISKSEMMYKRWTSPDDNFQVALAKTAAQAVLDADQSKWTLYDANYLSSFRGDAHPHVHAAASPPGDKASDCSHWCAPGVTNVINNMMFSVLVQKT